jgi:hypothetical protein
MSLTAYCLMLIVPLLAAVSENVLLGIGNDISTEGQREVERLYFGNATANNIGYYFPPVRPPASF